MPLPPDVRSPTLVFKIKVSKERAAETQGLERIRALTVKTQQERADRLSAKYAVRKLAFDQELANDKTRIATRQEMERRRKEELEALAKGEQERAQTEQAMLEKEAEERKSEFKRVAEFASMTEGAVIAEVLSSKAAHRPGSNLTADNDGLAKLKEWSQLRVIESVKPWILFVGIATLLSHLALYMWLADAEFEQVRDFQIKQNAVISELQLQMEMALTTKGKKTIEDKMLSLAEKAESAGPILKQFYFKQKLAAGFFAFIGIALIALYFKCDRYPREATATAFGVFFLATLVDGFYFQSGGCAMITIRIFATGALWRGVMAGRLLHKMRAESGVTV